MNYIIYVPIAHGNIYLISIVKVNNSLICPININHRCLCMSLMSYTAAFPSPHSGYTHTKYTPGYQLHAETCLFVHDYLWQCPIIPRFNIFKLKDHHMYPWPPRRGTTTNIPPRSHDHHDGAPRQTSHRVHMTTTTGHHDKHPTAFTWPPRRGTTTTIPPRSHDHHDGAPRQTSHRVHMTTTTRHHDKHPTAFTWPPRRRTTTNIPPRSHLGTCLSMPCYYW